jgi:putative ABC transport system permease protein
VSAAFAQERLVAMLSGVFGALALFLAGIGLYGVSSYAVSQRRIEIGVRIALGAAPRSVVHLILLRVAILTGLGIIEGVVLSFWALDQRRRGRTVVAHERPSASLRLRAAALAHT